MLVVDRPSLTLGTHVDLEMRTTEVGKEVTRKRGVCGDRLLHPGRIGEVVGHRCAAIGACRHANAGRIQQLREGLRPVDVLDDAAHVGLDALEAQATALADGFLDAVGPYVPNVGDSERSP